MKKIIERLNQRLGSDPEKAFNNQDSGKLAMQMITGGDGLKEMAEVVRGGVKMQNTRIIIQFALNKREQNKFEFASEEVKMELCNSNNGNTIAINGSRAGFLPMALKVRFGNRVSSLLTGLYDGLDYDTFTKIALSIFYSELMFLSEKANASKPVSDIQIVPPPAPQITSNGQLKNIPPPPVPKSGYLPPTGENSGKETGLDKSIDPSNQPTMPSAKSTSATTNLAGKNAKASYVVRPIAPSPHIRRSRAQPANRAS